jgi:hypothetical protein
LGEGPFDSFLEANFLVYSGVFGVLRRWILRPRYDRREVIEFLVQKLIKDVIARVQGEKSYLPEMIHGQVG